jgi:conjugal transfer mating pair stabilization protein TraN
MMDQAGRCHSLGTYCSDKWPLVGCVQKTEAFCCFNSMLARLIQEQGRPQLASFNPNPWGVATDDGPADADCRGFTSTEFQMLDFSKMDLSSYFGQITTQVQSTIQQNVSDQINSYYNSIQQQQ